MKPITLEDLHEARERESHAKALKKAKKEWNAQNSYSKRAHKWKLFLKLTADDLYAGFARCQQFSNNILE